MTARYDVGLTVRAGGSAATAWRQGIWMPSFRLEGPVLDGELVRLEPLDRRHAADLAVAAEEDRSSYRFTWVPRAADVGQ
jgi:hypothetical protein